MKFKAVIKKYNIYFKVRLKCIDTVLKSKALMLFLF